MKKMQKQARQGDVLIIHSSFNKLRPETKKRLFNTIKDKTLDFKKENRITLAEGEATNHTHAIYEEGAATLQYSKDVQETVKQLTANKEVILKHEEHEAICIPAGDSAVLIQNEYTMGVIQRVAD